MALQNRVMPDAQIFRADWRGDFMGNRGGRLHDPETRTLLKRRWASKRWIVCATEFKNRRRHVMGSGYTELFFLDEVSALAAGHRPCFECRRKDAVAYSGIWAGIFGKAEGSLADAIDKMLHEERTAGHPLISDTDMKNLPEGAMVMMNANSYAKRQGCWLRWSGEGYTESTLPIGKCLLLTPSSTLRVLANGYHPVWHKSAS